MWYPTSSHFLLLDHHGSWSHLLEAISLIFFSKRIYLVTGHLDIITTNIITKFKALLSEKNNDDLPRKLLKTMRHPNGMMRIENKMSFLWSNNQFPFEFVKRIKGFVTHKHQWSAASYKIVVPRVWWIFDQITQSHFFHTPTGKNATKESVKMCSFFVWVGDQKLLKQNWYF